MATVDYSVLIGKPLERITKLNLNRDAVDVDARTVKQMPITSDEPILHWVSGRGIAYIILDHQEKSINLERFKFGAPFLENHDPKIRLGRLRNGVSDGKVLRVDGRFNNKTYTNEVFQEVVDDLSHGDSPGLSTGFTIEKLSDKVEGYIDDFPIMRAIKWTPYEASLATMEADLVTGIGRCIGEPWQPARSIEENKDPTASTDDGDPAKNSTTAVRTKNMTEPLKEPAAPVVNPNPLVALEQRTKDFVSFALIFGNTDEQRTSLTELAREYALTGKSEEDLKTKIQEQRTQWIAKVPTAMPKLTETEKRQYSISRAILADASLRDRDVKGDTQCMELDISQDIEKRMNVPGYKPKGGFFIPTGIALRGLQPASANAQEEFVRFMRQMFLRAGLDTLTDTKGQELVFTEAGSFIDLLRKKAMVAQLGATVLPGLQGNVAFPKQIGAGTFSWVAENPGSDVADSNLTLDQVTLSPKTGMTSTSYSRQLLRQGVVDADGMVMSDIVKITALGIDLAALHGTGASNQPRGLYSTTGVGSVAFGGAITFAKVVDMETAIAAADAEIGTMAYLTTPNIRGTAKKTLEAASAGSKMIWQNGEMNGYRAEATNQISKTLGTGSDHGILFGVWAELMIGEWGAMEIITDPYRLKKQGMIEVTNFVMVDVAPRYPEAFCKGTTLVP